MLCTMMICLLLVLGKPVSGVEDGYLELSVKDAPGKPVKQVEITCKEQCSTSPSDSKGKARIKLPPNKHSDDWVTLILVVRPSTPNWVLISPWDDRVNVPSFANRAENVTSLIVVRKGDKQILSTGIALQSLAARCVGRTTPANKQTISDEERKLILKQQAEAVGLGPEEVDQAIREWGKKVQDPLQGGVAALYERNFPKAEELLRESYNIRKERFQTAGRDFADGAFFLGRSLFEQAKYSLAVNKFQEVIHKKG